MRELLEIEAAKHGVIYPVVEFRMSDLKCPILRNGFEAVEVMLVVNSVPGLEPPIAGVDLCLPQEVDVAAT
jgi:hypothetical protein